MREVYPTKEIAALWAKQQIPLARAPGNNFYFAGTTIYSYGSHFPIARFIDAPNGEKVVLVTTQGRSVTTARHKQHVAAVLPSIPLRKIYCDTIGDTFSTLANACNIEYFKRKHQKLHRLLQGARVEHTINWHFKCLHENMRNTRTYCEVFMLEPVPVWALIPESIQERGALLAALELHREVQPSNYV